MFSVIRNGILRHQMSVGSVAGRLNRTMAVRSMGVYKAPATDPFPDIKYEPDVFFGNVPPTAEEMATYTNMIKDFREKKESMKTKAYEVDFDAMREQAKNPQNLFPTLEDIDRMETYVNKRPFWTADPDGQYWTDRFDRIAKIFKAHNDKVAELEKEKTKLLKDVEKKDAKIRAIMDRIETITYNELAADRPEEIAAEEERYLAADPATPYDYKSHLIDELRALTDKFVEERGGSATSVEDVNEQQIAVVEQAWEESTEKAAQDRDKDLARKHKDMYEI